ncbi:hypothetical protein BJP27_02100 [Pseudomonas oryzihabitans]|nr:hypothetical protein BJP27_02100 [Pseudomonas psychrotolerans]
MLARFVPIYNIIHELGAAKEKYFFFQWVPIVEQVPRKITSSKLIRYNILIIIFVKLHIRERYDERAFGVFVDHLIDLSGNFWILANQDMTDVFKPCAAVDLMDLVKDIDCTRFELRVIAEYAQNFSVDIEHLGKFFQRLHQKIGVSGVSHFDIAAGTGEIPVLRQLSKNTLFRFPKFIDLERLMKPRLHFNDHQLASILLGEIVII